MRVIVKLCFPYWLPQTWFNLSPRVISIQDLIEDIVQLLELPSAVYSLSSDNACFSAELYAWELLHEGQVLSLTSQPLAAVPCEESYQANIEEFRHTAKIEEGDFVMFKYLDRQFCCGSGGSAGLFSFSLVG